jgi:hypothetical protein
MRQEPRLVPDSSAAHLYLELMKRCLINSIYRDWEDTSRDRDLRDEGPVWRTDIRAQWRRPAHSMAGMKRLDNIQFCMEDVLGQDVPGDFIETGVWRGGSTILMRAILKAYGIKDRVVWVADSFEGLPGPNHSKFPNDRGFDFSGIKELAISLEQVRANFWRYDLLDDQVRFLKGWFRDTLPVAPIDKLAVLRLDGDLYESTMDALVHLYPKLSVGGYVIIDDYGALLPCRQAVHEYRDAHGITDQIVPIDWTGSYWRRSA